MRYLLVALIEEGNSEVTLLPDRKAIQAFIGSKVRAVLRRTALRLKRRRRNNHLEECIDLS